MEKDNTDRDLCSFCGEARLNLDDNLDVIEGSPGEKGLCVNCGEGRRQYFKYGFTRNKK